MMGNWDWAARSNSQQAVTIVSRGADLLRDTVLLFYDIVQIYIIGMIFTVKHIYTLSYKVQINFSFLWIDYFYFGTYLP